MTRPIDAYALNIDRDSFDTYADYIRVFDMIAEAPTLKPQWIPCSKELPKRTGLYYVTIRDEKNDIEYTSCMNFYINLARWEVDVNVIAWMPEPEPYKEEE